GYRDRRVDDTLARRYLPDITHQPLRRGVLSDEATHMRLQLVAYGAGAVRVHQYDDGALGQPASQVVNHLGLTTGEHINVDDRHVRPYRLSHGYRLIYSGDLSDVQVVLKGQDRTGRTPQQVHRFDEQDANHVLLQTRIHGSLVTPGMQARELSHRGPVRDAA